MTQNKTITEQTIMDKVKSYEDACTIKGEDPVTRLPFSNPKNEREEALNAIDMLWLIIEVINEGFVKDYEDHNQDAYEPIFYLSVSGSGLSYGGYDFSFTATNVGARFALQTPEKARYVANQFAPLYNKYLVKKINK
jgi:hypothetical protein